MKRLRDIIESQEKYDKVKALYDRPGTPGEKAAAKAAMDRMRPPSDNPKVTAAPTATTIPHGFYCYHPKEKKYWGPYNHEKDASDNASVRYPARVVLHSSNTNTWRERSDHNKPHILDPDATFPHLDKKYK